MNFNEAVVEAFDAPRTCFILDSTIRNMSAMPGWDLTNDGVIDLARAAAACGVQMIEIDIVHGYMPSTKRLLGMFEAVAKQGLPFRLFGTANCTKRDIDDVVKAGGFGINLSERQAGQSGGDFANWREAAEYAQSRGLQVAANLPARLEQVSPHQAAEQINEMTPRPAYVGIHENNGSASPEAWRWAMKMIRAELIDEVPIVPHIHNNLGLGSATAAAAVTGGAKGIDLAMCAIGIHGGHAALEQVVVALELLYGVHTGIQLDQLNEYARVVRRVSGGVSMDVYGPIVGEGAFVLELEPFAEQVLLNREQARERVHPFVPSLVGAKNSVAWGANTLFGDATRVKLRQMGLPHADSDVTKVIEVMSAALAKKTRYPRLLSESEVEALARTVLA
jgi:isopropylmalate/homocitrate/citramalate synthase